MLANPTDTDWVQLPCGSEDCFIDPGLNNPTGCTPHCLIPDHYVAVPETGVCELKECHLRIANMTADEYTLPCGSEDCFIDPTLNNPTGCTPHCLVPDHYVAVPETGMCELKECHLRTANMTVDEYMLPCGSEDCFFDLYAAACVYSCLEPAYYVEDKNTGKCVEKECADIDVDVCRSASWCVETENDPPLCARTCSDTAHYEVSSEVSPDSPTYHKCVSRNGSENESSHSEADAAAGGMYTARQMAVFLLVAVVCGVHLGAGCAAMVAVCVKVIRKRRSRKSIERSVLNQELLNGEALTAIN